MTQSLHGTADSVVSLTHDVAQLFEKFRMVFFEQLDLRRELLVDAPANSGNSLVLLDILDVDLTRQSVSLRKRDQCSRTAPVVRTHLLSVQTPTTNLIPYIGKVPVIGNL